MAAIHVLLLKQTLCFCARSFGSSNIFHTAGQYDWLQLDDLDYTWKIKLKVYSIPTYLFRTFACGTVICSCLSQKLSVWVVHNLTYLKRSYLSGGNWLDDLVCNHIYNYVFEWISNSQCLSRWCKAIRTWLSQIPSDSVKCRLTHLFAIYPAKHLNVYLDHLSQWKP